MSLPKTAAAMTSLRRDLLQCEAYILAMALAACAIFYFTTGWVDALIWFAICFGMPQPFFVYIFWQARTSQRQNKTKAVEVEESQISTESTPLWKELFHFELWAVVLSAFSGIVSVFVPAIVLGPLTVWQRGFKFSLVVFLVCQIVLFQVHGESIRGWFRKKGSKE